MYSKHGCKNFIPILTNDAESVCSECGIVLEEKLEVKYLTGTLHYIPSIQICDENRFGSQNISPKGFTGEKNKRLNPTNKKILDARQKPQRMLFTNTCTAIGLGVDHSRTALHYYDVLHEIRTKLKQNISYTNTFSKIIATLQKSKTLTESNILKSMVSSKHWNSTDDAKKWIKEIIGYNSFDNISKIKKPKKLSTLNISFLSIYQVVCDNNIRITKDQIMTAIAQHMKFTREINPTSALAACKTALNLEKKTQITTPILKHDILLESSTLPTEKIKRSYYMLSPMIRSKKNAVKLKRELEKIS